MSLTSCATGRGVRVQEVYLIQQTFAEACVEHVSHIHPPHAVPQRDNPGRTLGGPGGGDRADASQDRQAGVSADRNREWMWRLHCLSE